MTVGRISTSVLEEPKRTEDLICMTITKSSTLDEIGRIRRKEPVPKPQQGLLRRAFLTVMARESAAPATPYYESHVASRYSFALTKMPPKGTILDVGTGTAFGIMHSGAPDRFIGGDKNRFALQIAGQQHPELENRLFRIDACHLNFDGLVGITAFELLEHLNRRQKKMFLMGARRSLRQGGVLVLSTPLSFGPVRSLNLFHFGKELDLPQLKELMGRYFSRVDYYGLGLMPQRTLAKLTVRANELVSSLDILHLRRALVSKKMRNSFFEITSGETRIRAMEEYQRQGQLPRNVVAVAVK